MKKNVLFLALVCGGVIAAQLGTLNPSSDVVTATELAEDTVDPTAMQAQIDLNADALDGGITTNYVVSAGDTLTIEDGVIKGIN